MGGWRLCTVALALLLAGCMAGPQEAQPAQALPGLDALGAAVAVKHDHTDRALHEDVARGLSVLDASALSDDGTSLGEYREADHARGLVAVTSTLKRGATFVLLDAEALPALRVLSSTFEPGASGDVKLDREEPLLYHAFPGDATAFSVWDVSDPTRPVKLATVRGEGCHMLSPQRIGGVPHVWCAGYQPTLYRLERTPAGLMGVAIARVTPQSDPETLRYASYYEELVPAGPVGLVGALTAHDMTAQDDPLAPGRPLLVVAYELQGIRVMDVSTPVAPREVAHWRGEGLPGPMHRIHTAFLAQVGERRIAFAATETFHHVAPEVYVVDFTDLAKPRLLAVWTPPGIEDDGHILFSAHNLQVVGGRMYVANFHGGMWVVDVSDPEAPRTLAVRQPVRDTDYPEKGKMLLPDVPLDVNSVWDVVVVRGYALVTDVPAGVEVLAVDGDPHGDPAWSSFA